MPRTQPEREDDDEEISSLFQTSSPVCNNRKAKEKNEDEGNELNATVNISDFNAPKTKKDHKKFSAWMVTVNCNIQWHDPEDPRIPKFAGMMKDTFEYLLKTKHEFLSVLSFPSNVRSRDIDFSKSYSNASIEMGPVKKQIHGHIFIQIQHSTRVRLMYAGLKQWLKKEFMKRTEELDLPWTNNGNFHVFYELCDDLNSALEQKEQIIAYINKRLGKSNSTTTEPADDAAPPVSNAPTPNEELRDDPTHTKVVQPDPEPKGRKRKSETTIKVPYKKLALPNYQHLLINKK
jgi:hypothetical protein